MFIRVSGLQYNAADPWKGEEFPTKNKEIYKVKVKDIENKVIRTKSSWDIDVKRNRSSLSWSFRWLLSTDYWTLSWNEKEDRIFITSIKKNAIAIALN